MALGLATMVYHGRGGNIQSAEVMCAPGVQPTHVTSCSHCSARLLINLPGTPLPEHRGTPPQPPSNQLCTRGLPPACALRHATSHLVCHGRPLLDELSFSVSRAF